MNPSVPRIKICGITRPEDAALARELGVDAIGLVFYAQSPRAVTLPAAKKIARVAGPFVTVTGLFVNAAVEQVQAVLKEVPLHALQFHGEESADYCHQFQRPWIKALRIKADVDLAAAVDQYRDASALLFDTYKAGVQGGTGEAFDWSLVSPGKMPSACDLPVILAGGLNADNVAQAIECVKPYAVDVSGGVESAPGVKDAEKVRAFIRAVKHGRTI